MLNDLLLEVECKKKAPKGPPNDGEPEDPKQASPIELLRAAITINTRRQNLIDTLAKHKALTTALASASMAKKAKIDHDLACQKLALAAAENWVKFSLKRWKKLADFAGEHGVPTAKLKTALIYGNQQAGLGNTHLSLLNTDKPLPAVDDLSFDHASHTFKKDGATYSLDGIIDLMSKPAPTPAPAPVAEPEPVEDPVIAAKAAASYDDAKKTAAELIPEPEPAPAVPAAPSEITALSDAHKAAISDAAKAAFLHAVATEDPTEAVSSVILDKALSGVPLSDEAWGAAQMLIVQANKDISATDADMPAIQGFADELVADYGPVDYKVLAKVLAKKLGKITFSHSLEGALLKAKSKIGTSWSNVSQEDRDKGKTALEKVYQKESVDAAMKGEVYQGLSPETVKSVFQSTTGIQLNPAAVTSAQMSGTLGLFHTFDKDSHPITFSQVMQKASAVYASSPLTVESALADGIVSVNAFAVGPEAFKTLLGKFKEHIEPKAKPVDVMGFQAAIKAALEKPGLQSTVFWSPMALDAIGVGSGKDISALAADFGIDHWSDYQSKVLETVDLVKIKKFDGPGFREACFKAWDEKAKSQTVTWDQHGEPYIFHQLDLDKEFNVSDVAVKSIGAYSKTDYLVGIFDLWMDHNDAKTKDAAPAPVAPPPVVTAPAPAPAPIPVPAAKMALPPGFTYFYASYKKISKPTHLNDAQTSYLALKCAMAIDSGMIYTAKGDLGPKKVGSATNWIHEGFKADWASSGVTQIGKPLVAEILNHAIDVTKAGFTPGTKDFFAELLAKMGKPSFLVGGLISAPSTPVAAPVTPTVPAPGAPAGATLQNIPALFSSLMASYPDELTLWEKDHIVDIWEKTIGAGLTTPGFGAFTYEREDHLNAFLKKAQKLLSPAPGVPPIATSGEVGVTAPAAAYQAAGLKPKDNPLGMTYEEIAAFCATTKPAGSPEMPPGTENWQSKSFIGGDSAGGSKKWLLGINADGSPTDATFTTKPPADGAWMFKPESSAFRAFGEIASNRVQALLGFAATTDAWTTTFKGEFGSVQKFQRSESNFRSKGIEDSPWKEGPQAVAELQKYFVLNFLTSENDDHGANFAITPDGRLKGLDRAQAMKFFDSSHSALDYYNLGDTIPFPYYAVQNDSKGMPVKVMKHWANGGNITLPPLTDPAFESVVARAEAIPSEIYKDMWRGYAEGAATQPYPSHHTGNHALGEASKVAADKTVDGFLEGVNQRRKNVRASIGSMYAALAKTRAQALKNKGDARPMAEIESEIRDQLGIDAFLKGNKPAKEVSPIPEADLAPPSTSDEAWSNPNLPATSQVPTVEALTKQGTDGVDMVVGGADVKDGRVQFMRVGKNDLSLAYLDTAARAKLEAMLPGAGGTPAPITPTKPSYPPIAPVSEPTFEVLTNRDLWRQVMAVSGSSSKTHTKNTEITKVGEQQFRAEKHILNWEEGKEVSTSGFGYLVESAKKAQQLAASADPLIAAAGKHYVAEFARIGVTPTASFGDLKPSSSFPAIERKFSPFVPTAEVLQAREEAKKNSADAFATAYGAALVANNAAKAAIDVKFDEDMAKHDVAKKDYDALMASGNKLPATKYDHWMIPKDVTRLSDQDGANAASKETTWNGEFRPSFDKERGLSMPTYEIDLTESLTGVSPSGLAPSKRLMVHYVPAKVTGSSRKFPGRSGQLRIMYPEGSTTEQIREYTRRVYAKFGLDTRPATTEEQELGYLRRMAWLRKIEGYKSPGAVTVESEPAGPTSAKINFWIEKFKADPQSGTSWSAPAGGLGYDPRLVPIMVGGKPKKSASGEVLYKAGPDGKPMKNSAYVPEATNRSGKDRTAFRRFDITDEEMDGYIKAGVSLSKRSSGLGPYRETWLNTGSLYSTERTLNLGFLPHGQSWDSDISTGGSNWNYLFIRVPQEGGLNQLGYDRVGEDPDGNAWMGVDLRILLHTSTWENHDDDFGTTTDYSGHDVKNRAGSVQEALLPEMVSHSKKAAEVYVGDRISFPEWLTYYRAPDATTRMAWIKRLKDAGTHTMGPDNLPVEEIISTKSYAQVLADRKAKTK